MSLYNNGNVVKLNTRLQKEIELLLVRKGIAQLNISKEDSKTLLGLIRKDPSFENVHRYPIKKDGVKFYEFNFVKPERWKHLQASNEL
jgi:hypothetical protein